MSLGFGLDLSGAGRRRSAPWWHAYRAGPGGPLPSVVIEDEGARSHGATQLGAGIFDLSGVPLGPGFTFFVRGFLNYSGEVSNYPRFAEIGTSGDISNRQAIFFYRPTGHVWATGFDSGVPQVSLDISKATQPDAVAFQLVARFAPNDFAATFNGGPLLSDTACALPAGLNRLFLRTSEGAGATPGLIQRAVIWTQPLSPALMQSYSA